MSRSNYFPKARTGSKDRLPHEDMVCLMNYHNTISGVKAVKVNLRGLPQNFSISPFECSPIADADRESLRQNIVAFAHADPTQIDRMSFAICPGDLRVRYNATAGRDYRAIEGDSHWTGLHLRRGPDGRITAYCYNSMGRNPPESVARVLHAFNIPLQLVEVEQQNDGWSCGYRTMKNLIAANRSDDPGNANEINSAVSFYGPAQLVTERDGYNIERFVRDSQEFINVPLPDLAPPAVPAASAVVSPAQKVNEEIEKILHGTDTPGNKIFKLAQVKGIDKKAFNECINYVIDGVLEEKVDQIRRNSRQAPDNNVLAILDLLRCKEILAELKINKDDKDFREFCHVLSRFDMGDLSKAAQDIAFLQGKYTQHHREQEDVSRNFFGLMRQGNFVEALKVIPSNSQIEHAVCYGILSNAFAAKPRDQNLEALLDIVGILIAQGFNVNRPVNGQPLLFEALAENADERIVDLIAENSTIQALQHCLSPNFRFDQRYQAIITGYITKKTEEQNKYASNQQNNLREKYNQKLDELIRKLSAFSSISGDSDSDEGIAGSPQDLIQPLKADLKALLSSQQTPVLEVVVMKYLQNINNAAARKVLCEFAELLIEGGAKLIHAGDIVASYVRAHNSQVDATLQPLLTSLIVAAARNRSHEGFKHLMDVFASNPNMPMAVLFGNNDGQPDKAITEILHAAIDNKTPGIIERLLQNNSITQQVKNAALEYAVVKDSATRINFDWRVVDALVENGAYFNKPSVTFSYLETSRQNSLSDKIFIYAAKRNPVDVEQIKRFFEKNYNPSLSDAKGNNILQVAIREIGKTQNPDRKESLMQVVAYLLDGEKFPWRRLRFPLIQELQSNCKDAIDIQGFIAADYITQEEYDAANASVPTPAGSVFSEELRHYVNNEPIALPGTEKIHSMDDLNLSLAAALALRKGREYAKLSKSKKAQFDKLVLSPKMIDSEASLLYKASVAGSSPTYELLKDQPPAVDGRPFERLALNMALLAATDRRQVKSTSEISELVRLGAHSGLQRQPAKWYQSKGNKISEPVRDIREPGLIKKVSPLMQCVINDNTAAIAAIIRGNGSNDEDIQQAFEFAISCGSLKSVLAFLEAQVAIFNGPKTGVFSLEGDTYKCWAYQAACEAAKKPGAASNANYGLIKDAIRQQALKQFFLKAKVFAKVANIPGVNPSAQITIEIDKKSHVITQTFNRKYNRYDYDLMIKSVNKDKEVTSFEGRPDEKAVETLRKLNRHVEQNYKKTIIAKKKEFRAILDELLNPPRASSVTTTDSRPALTVYARCIGFIGNIISLDEAEEKNNIEILQAALAEAITRLNGENDGVKKQILQQVIIQIVNTGLEISRPASDAFERTNRAQQDLAPKIIESGTFASLIKDSNIRARVLQQALLIAASSKSRDVVYFRELVNLWANPITTQFNVDGFGLYSQHIDQHIIDNAPRKMVAKDNVLHAAFRNGNIDILQELLRNASALQIGELLKAKNSQGETPMMVAARYDQWQLLESLFDSKKFPSLKDQININLQNDSGVTPLMYASKYGSRLSVITLLGYGAKKGIKATAGSDKGLKALDYAKIPANRVNEKHYPETEYKEIVRRLDHIPERMAETRQRDEGILVSPQPQSPPPETKQKSRQQSRATYFAQPEPSKPKPRKKLTITFIPPENVSPRVQQVPSALRPDINDFVGDGGINGKKRITWKDLQLIRWNAPYNEKPDRISTNAMAGPGGDRGVPDLRHRTVEQQKEELRKKYQNIKKEQYVRLEGSMADKFQVDSRGYGEYFQPYYSYFEGLHFVENGERLGQRIFNDACIFMTHFKDCVFQNVDFSAMDAEIIRSLRFHNCTGLETIKWPLDSRGQAIKPIIQTKNSEYNEMRKERGELRAGIEEAFKEAGIIKGYGYNHDKALDRGYSREADEEKKAELDSLRHLRRDAGWGIDKSLEQILPSPTAGSATAAGVLRGRNQNRNE